MYRGLSAAIDDDDAPAPCYRSLAAADDGAEAPRYRSAAAAAAPAPAAPELDDVKLEESDLSREQFNRFFKKEKAAGAF